MDPVQALAGTTLSGDNKSTAKEIEAFYDAHSFEQFYKARRAIIGLVGFIRKSRYGLDDRQTAGPKVASTASRA